MSFELDTVAFIYIPYRQVSLCEDISASIDSVGGPFEARPFYNFKTVQAFTPKI